MTSLHLSTLNSKLSTVTMTMTYGDDYISKLLTLNYNYDDGLWLMTMTYHSLLLFLYLG